MTQKIILAYYTEHKEKWSSKKWEWGQLCRKLPSQKIKEAKQKNK